MENDGEKLDEIMLPGFRFHPTDEELVGFYLRRKIQQRPLSIELIRQLDIYKYDPWDLPKLATTGEKEWYFYCPRDRKYRNSARPNRVTGAGFWKATGTDRPIYSSEGPSKCIGLKKSLVFYKGRAAKGMKTDWMMHEFRLPSLSDTGPCKRFLDKDNIPANDAWAICRIFKKANSSAQRALSHSWVSQQLSPNEPSPITSTTTTSHDLVYGTIFNPNDISLANKNTIGTTSLIQFGDSSTTTSDAQQQSSMASTTFSPVNQNPNPNPPYKPILNNNGAFPYEPSTDCTTTTTTIDASSLLLNMSSQPAIFGGFDEKVSQEQQYFHNFPVTLPDEHHEDVMRSRSAYYHGEHEEGGNGRPILASINDPNVGMMRDQAQYLETMQSLGYPFNLPLNNMGQDAWKCNLFWDSSPCPSNDLSTSFSTNKCYT